MLYCSQTAPGLRCVLLSSYARCDLSWFSRFPLCFSLAVLNKQVAFDENMIRVAVWTFLEQLIIQQRTTGQQKEQKSSSCLFLNWLLFWQIASVR